MVVTDERLEYLAQEYRRFLNSGLISINFEEYLTIQINQDAWVKRDALKKIYERIDKCSS